MKSSTIPFIIICILAGSFGIPSCSTLPQRSPTINPTYRITLSVSSPSATFQTPTQTTIPSPSSTPFPNRTHTPTPHPLSIENMRQQVFSESEIIIEETLEPGYNYQRYIASYLSEGLKIFALLTVPNEEPPPTGFPVIIFNHGYIAPREYRTTERYVAYVDAFARRGYIVFRSDYRGHGNSEGQPARIHMSPAYTIDVLNGMNAIKKYPLSDPNRIGMWGHSMGGEITLRSMVVSKDIKAAVIWAGVVAAYPDVLLHRHADSKQHALPTAEQHRTDNELWKTFGFPEDKPEYWAAISPNSYLKDLSGPVQLHHGTLDSTVPIAFSAQLYKQIKEIGGNVEYFTYAGDNHNISANFSLAMYRSLSFFDKYVKNTLPISSNLDK